MSAESDHSGRNVLDWLLSPIKTLAGAVIRAATVSMLVCVFVSLCVGGFCGYRLGKEMTRSQVDKLDFEKTRLKARVEGLEKEADNRKTGAAALTPSAPARHDFFLEALRKGRIMCFNPGTEIGEGTDMFRIDSWDLPRLVSTGQVVHSRLVYSLRSGRDKAPINPHARVFKTVLAEWQPDTPVCFLENGELQGPARTVVKEFEFKAPPEPGQYRIRISFVWAQKEIGSFYGEGLYYGGDGPGVSHFVESWMVVRAP
jgi:hypothetical protein